MATPGAASSTVGPVLEKECEYNRRNKVGLCLIMFDIDHFKQINDRHGHLAGDQCLTHLSQLLKETSRANDYVFRIGGEEFLILSINDSHEGSRLLAETGE